MLAAALGLATTGTLVVGRTARRRARERGGISVFAQLVAGFHPREALADVRFAAVETGGDHRAGVWIALGQVAGERTIEQRPRPCSLI